MRAAYMPSKTPDEQTYQRALDGRERQFLGSVTGIGGQPPHTVQSVLTTLSLPLHFFGRLGTNCLCQTRQGDPDGVAQLGANPGHFKPAR